VVSKYSERMVKRRAMPEYGLGEWEGIVRTVERAGHDYKN